MTRQEFTALLGAPVSDGFWRDIEIVYTYHPSISEVDGKAQIVYLFRTHGMRIICDMLESSRVAKRLEEGIRMAQLQLQEAKESYELYKLGVT